MLKQRAVPNNQHLQWGIQNLIGHHAIILSVYAWNEVGSFIR